MQATVRVSKGGVVVIPIEVRDAMGISPGDLIVIDVIQKVVQQEQGNAEADATASPVQA
jgi:AbrB family looped-hinge helix DNA binding protein